jgi:Fe-S cluster assembly scaffold protein SufB
VIVDSLSHAAGKYPDLVSDYYSKIADPEEDAVTALNTMLAQDGLLIYVPKNTRIPTTYPDRKFTSFGSSADGQPPGAGHPGRRGRSKSSVL